MSKLFSKKPNAGATIQAQEEAPRFERVSWTKEPGLRQLYFYAVVLCVASATTGYDGMLFNSVQAFDTWKDYFGNPQGQMLGLLGALYQIGSMISIFFVPFFTDHFGRKVPIVMGCVIMIVGAVLQGCCQNLAIVAWLSFGTNYIPNEWSWRIPCIIQGLPSLIQLTFIYWVPESPRYLIAKDKHDQALAMLAKYHGNGDAQHPTVQFEYHEIKETLKLELEHKNASKYSEFLRTKGNRYRLAILISLGVFSQWSGNAIISNYVAVLYDTAGVKGSTDKLGLAGGQTVLSTIVSISMALLVDRVGRRPMFLASTGGMFLTFIFWTLTSGLYEEKGLDGARFAMIFFIWVHGIFYSLAWSGLLIGYAIEVLPYKLRAKGLMIMNVCVQASLTLNVYANPLAFEHFTGHLWKLYLIYTCWILGEVIFVYFMYVETRGPTLEELAKIIDGDQAEVARVDLDSKHYSEDHVLNRSSTEKVSNRAV
ncbi:hexose transporter protein [Pyricularia oryzae Y34]|uniref:Hexose transporter protein n=2 Tax=Pyricularia oryzae TaxID=318829 RepID=A0AA97P280_PYRO3|nr:hexose transporter protein [Pyricularia oryzae Y34]